MFNTKFSVFRQLSLVSCLLLSALVLTACNFKEEKTSGDESDDPSIGTGDTPDTGSGAPKISFATIDTQIIKPACIACHSAAAASGGVALDTYAKVKAEIAAIKKTTVDEKTMPQGGSLSASKIQLLQSWIEQGAVENP